MRSLLLVRADCENDIGEVLGSGADCLVFDLARAVAADLSRARKFARAALEQARQRAERPALYVRVNGLGSDLIDADLEAIMPARPDGIVLPCTQHGADVQHLSVKLAVHEAEQGFDDGATKIIAMAAETPASIFHMGSHAGASRRLAGLIYGKAALAHALGAETCTFSDGTLTPPFALAQSLVLFAAKAANVIAIDAASPVSSDDAGLRRDCKAARRDGFSGKLALDRRQIPIINAMFEQGAAAG